MFGTIMTCLLTWDKIILNGFKKIVRSVLSNPTYCPSTYLLRSAWEVFQSNMTYLKTPEIKSGSIKIISTHHAHVTICIKAVTKPSVLRT